MPSGCTGWGGGGGRTEKQGSHLIHSPQCPALRFLSPTLGSFNLGGSPDDKLMRCHAGTKGFISHPPKVLTLAEAKVLGSEGAARPGPHQLSQIQVRSSGSQ